jgi:lipopolysaccharide export system permease protein
MRVLSKYLLREFFSFLIYCVLAFVVIFILVDTVEHLDKLIDEQVPVRIIVLYYVFYIPYITVLTLPIAMLLTTMFSLGRLVSDNEITAIKASGQHLYRFLMPLYVFALLVSLLIMAFGEFVVPVSNRLREDIERDGAAFRFTLSRNVEMDRGQVFLRNGEEGVIYALHYDSVNKKAKNVFIIESYEKLNKETGKMMKGISRRYDAEFMVWSNNSWNLYNVQERIFDGDKEKLQVFGSLAGDFIKVKPSDLAKIETSPEQMNYFELENYIKSIKERGGDASEWLVDLYMKVSFPFVTFVIVFFGAPMVAGSMRRGKAASFGIALVISFLFYTLVNTFQILGRNGSIEPIIAAWAPNALFLFVGIVMHINASK